jgi:hypothetical protein
MTVVATPVGSPRRMPGCALVGSGQAVLAALEYAVLFGVVVALDGQPDSMDGFVGLALGMAAYAATVGVLVAVPLGAAFGVLLGAVLRRRPTSPGRGALVGAGVVLVATSPVLALLLLASPITAVLFGVGPVAFGAGAAAVMGRSLCVQLDQGARSPAEVQPVSRGG